MTTPDVMTLVDEYARYRARAAVERATRARSPHYTSEDVLDDDIAALNVRDAIKAQLATLREDA